MRRGSTGPAGRSDRPGVPFRPGPETRRRHPMADRARSGRSRPSTGRRCVRSPAGSSDRSVLRCSRSAPRHQGRRGRPHPGDRREPRGGGACGARSARRPAARRSPSPTSGTATGRSRRRRSPSSWGRMPRTRSPSCVGSASMACAASPSARSRRRSSRTRSCRGSTTLIRSPRRPAPPMGRRRRALGAGGRRAGGDAVAASPRPPPWAWISIATRRGSSRTDARRGRSCSATETPLSSRRREDPLPRIAGRDAFPSDDGGVDPRGRPAHPARGHG